MAVIGTLTGDGRLCVVDSLLGVDPVDMPLEVLLGKAPRMTRDVASRAPVTAPLDLGGLSLRDAAYRVLRLPAVADKTFLVTIGDRSVGGMIHRDPMVGPWQVPVADCAVTASSFREGNRWDFPVWNMTTPSIRPIRCNRTPYKSPLLTCEFCSALARLSRHFSATDASLLPASARQVISRVCSSRMYTAIA